MEKRKMIRLWVLVLALVSFIWLLPSAGKAQTMVMCTVGLGDQLQDAIDAASSGDTLQVSGTCDENVRIREGKDRLTLDGGGTATIDGPFDSFTIGVRARGVTIKRFLLITGVSGGIHVFRGGTVVIDSNTIDGTGGNGILVNQHSFARIIKGHQQKGFYSEAMVTERPGSHCFSNDGDLMTMASVVT